MEKQIAERPRDVEVSVADSSKSPLNRVKSMVRPIVVATVGTTLVAQVLSALRGILLARVLGPAGRGEFGTIMAYAQMFTFVGVLGTHNAVARRAAREKGKLDDLVGASARLGICTGLGSMLMAMSLYMITLPPGKRYLMSLCIAVTMLLPLQHMRVSLLAVDRGSGAFSRYNINHLLFNSSFPIMLVIAWYFGFASLSVIVCLSILQPAVAFVVLVATRPESIFRRSYKPKVISLVGEGMPYALAQVTTNLFSRIDVFAVLYLATVEAQGLYLAALPIAGLMLNVPQALGMFTFRGGARVDGRVPLRKVILVAGVVLAVQFVSAAVLMLIAGPMVRIFYGEAFADAIAFTLVLIPAFAVRGAAQTADQFLRARKKSLIGVWSRLISSIAIGVVLAILYPTMQIHSLPWAALAGHLLNASIIFVALLFNCRKDVVLDAADATSDSEQSAE